MLEANETSLVTIECARSGSAYEWDNYGPILDLHLAAPSAGGGIGPCLCGFDRHARDESGRSLVGFSVGGGVTGPGVEHAVCSKCARIAGNRPIRGTNAALFNSFGVSPSVLEGEK